MSEELQQQTIDAYFDGINNDRFEQVAALFSQSGKLIAPGSAPRTGPDQIAGYFAAALAAYPEHYDDPVRVIHAPGSATVEIRYTGRLANGNQIEFDAVDLFDFDAAGKIARLVSAYDSHRVRTRLAMARGGDHRNILLAALDHQEGEEEQFNSWYERHIAEVLGVPGVRQVQRYRYAGLGTPLRRWICIYHLDGPAEPVLAEIARRRGAGDWEPRVALIEESVSLAAYEPIRVDGSPIG